MHLHAFQMKIGAAKTERSVPYTVKSALPGYRLYSPVTDFILRDHNSHKLPLRALAIVGEDNVSPFEDTL